VDINLGKDDHLTLPWCVSREATGHQRRTSRMLRPEASAGVTKS
jgi:hypothetical protein